MKTGIVLCVVLMGLAGSAQAERYDCKMGHVSRLGWVGKQYVFVVDRSGGKVMALDGLIQEVNKGPIEADIIEDTPDRLRIKWMLRNLKGGYPSGGGHVTIPRVTYAVRILKSTGRISVRAHVAGNDVESTGQGKCDVSG